MKAVHHARPMIVLTRDNVSGRDGALAQQMFDSLVGFYEPCTIALEVGVVDKELGLELEQTTIQQPFYRMTGANEFGVQARPRYPNPVEHAEKPSASGVRRWIDGVLSANGHAEQYVCWRTLVVTAARVVTTCQDKSVEFLDLQGQPFTAPVHVSDGKRWIAGPLANSSMDPPITLAMRWEGFTSTLTLGLVWPQWSTPGTADYRAMIERLRALISEGWMVVSRPDGILDIKF